MGLPFSESNRNRLGPSLWRRLVRVGRAGPSPSPGNAAPGREPNSFVRRQNFLPWPGPFRPAQLPTQAASLSKNGWTGSTLRKARPPCARRAPAGTLIAPGLGMRTHDTPHECQHACLAAIALATRARRSAGRVRPSSPCARRPGCAPLLLPERK